MENLPDEIIVIPNADKDFHEAVDHKNLANMTSEEYNDLDAEYVDEIPEVDFFDRSMKNLFILEDINFRRLKRDQEAR